MYIQDVRDSHRRIKHREYATCRTRKLSFGIKRFPTGPNVQELASAGFFYAGHKDYLRCYSCGVLIMNWSRGLDPVTIHRQKSPNCSVLHIILEEELPETTVSEDNHITDRLHDIQLQHEQGRDNENIQTQTLHSETPFVRTDSYIERIEREVTQLRETLMCKVCMDNSSNVVLMPCGHLTSCLECSSVLTQCPQCRAGISKRIKVYI